MRVCFPHYLDSKCSWGKIHWEIFVENVNILNAKAIWAYFASMVIYAARLQLRGYINYGFCKLFLSINNIDA